MRSIKILAIGTSSNRSSINLTLAAAAASLVDGAGVESLSVADYELPLFSDAREAEIGRPPLASEFLERIREVDGIVVSFAEYNGTFTASFKNIFDWASRVNKEVFQDKPAVFLSASPGPGGAANVLLQALGSAEFWGADVVGSLSVPSFNDNFDYQRSALIDVGLCEKLAVVMRRLRGEIISTREREQDAGHKFSPLPRAKEQYKAGLL